MRKNTGFDVSSIHFLNASAAAIAIALAAFSAPASAQNESNTAASDTSSGQLEEIIVTAQRREENIQNTPLSVSAFTADSLLKSGVKSVGELAHVDPSLNIQSSGGAYIPFLRGIGNNAGNLVGNESSVAVYIDDLYYTRLATPLLSLNSIQRVEVLKGPQGTLFGRNSSGGAIQVFTRDPGRDAQVEGSVGYGNFNTWTGKLYLSAPITENLGWNISVSGLHQGDGWGRNEGNGQDAYKTKYISARSKLVWEPTDATKVKLVGFYSNENGDLHVTQDRYTGTLGATPAIAAAGYPNPPIPISPRADLGHFYDTYTNEKQFWREESYGGSLRIDQEVKFADLVSITGFRHSEGLGRFDGDFSPYPFNRYDLYFGDRQFSQELQVKSKADSTVKWIIGAFYLRSESGYFPDKGGYVTGDQLGTLGLHIRSKQIIHSYSVFGQGTVPLGDKTNLTLGLRYTKDKVRGIGSEDLDIPGVGNVPFTAAMGGQDPYDKEFTFNKLTYKAALDHHLTDDIMVYASVSRGYKSGTFNTLPLDADPAKAEVVDAYEVGIKTELLDRRLRLNGALFWNDITNPQVLTTINKGLTNGIGLTNAKSARVKGFELTMEAVVAEGLSLRAATTYLDGKYRDFTNAPYFLPLPPGQGVAAPVIMSANGNRMSRVPEWRWDAGVNYTVESGIGKFVADTSLSHMGNFKWDADNLLTQRSYTLLNASLSLTPASLDWLTVQLWGKNLTKEKYYETEQEVVGGTGYIATAAAPRTYGVELTMKF